jgi:putative ATP-dependent endonuclease of the OLD family
MYLHRLTVQGFRRLDKLELRFREGLNLLVGPNNAGKSAVIDALRILLASGDDGALRVTDLDLHVSPAGHPREHATFVYVFRCLSPDEEAGFIQALKPVHKEGEIVEYEAQLSVRCSAPDLGGRLRIKRWAGDHEEHSVSSEMLDELRAVYLPPLRDPAQGLRPGRSSQLARLIQSLSSPAAQHAVVQELRALDTTLKAMDSIQGTQTAIATRHLDMLGPTLSQSLEINLSPTDFKRIAARLGLLVSNFEVEQNGLGFNNLIYMAVVLSELSLSKEASYRALLVEEPEAHLHPQLQAVLLSYLKSVEKPAQGEKAVQVFLTSHSPNFAAMANIDSIGCIYQTVDAVETFFPREAIFEKRKKEKLQRYLNVTRAEIFFARKIILVEGAAELFMIEAMAKQLGYDLKKHAVSVISADGLNFDAFMPLFGSDAMKVRVAVLSDSDEDGYPAAGAVPALSPQAKAIQSATNEFIQAFFGLKTFEYNLALTSKNHSTMLTALKEINPGIGADIDVQLASALEEEKPRMLFQSMFERGKGKANIQKGAFGQALAQSVLLDGLPLEVPLYIKDAFKFVCES